MASTLQITRKYSELIKISLTLLQAGIGREFLLTLWEWTLFDPTRSLQIYS